MGLTSCYKFKHIFHHIPGAIFAHVSIYLGQLVIFFCHGGTKLSFSRLSDGEPFLYCNSMSGLLLFKAYQFFKRIQRILKKSQRISIYTHIHTYTHIYAVHIRTYTHIYPYIRSHIRYIRIYTHIYAAIYAHIRSFSKESLLILVGRHIAIPFIRKIINIPIL